MRKIEFLGKMPSPFIKDDGTKVSPKEWETYKYEILEKIVDIEFGGMPPKPEVVKIETLNMVHRGIFPNCYRIHAGTKEKQLNFILDICVPVNEKISRYRIEDGEKFPVLLCGDGCYPTMDLKV